MSTHLMAREVALGLCGKWQDGDQWAPSGNLDSVDCDICLALVESVVVSAPSPTPSRWARIRRLFG